MSEPTPAELFDHVQTLANGIRERDTVIKQLLAQLPPDGRGRWRQGTKNPRNLYVHQGDDETGQPVGQMYSAELAALVCDAVNGQRECAEQAEAALETAEDLHARQLQDRDAELAEAEAQIRAADDVIARVKALADDMRTWCSPHGIAVTYAQRIDEAIEPPEPVGIEADSEAEFAAKIGAIMRKHRAEVHPEHDEACANCAVIKGAPEILTAGLERSEVVPGPLVLREPTEAELARTKAALAEALDRNDLPAVRAFVADFDPRQEST